MKGTVLLAALWVSTAAFAHHSADKPSEGTIRRSGYADPHRYVERGSGDTTWNGVLAPPTYMQDREWQRAARAGALAVRHSHHSTDHGVRTRAILALLLWVVMLRAGRLLAYL